MKVAMVNYGVVNSTGKGVDCFFRALKDGSISKAKDGVHRIGEKPDGLSSQSRLVSLLSEVWREARTGVLPGVIEHNLGIILATTKGTVEDNVWKSSLEQTSTDSLGSLLDQFIKLSELKPVKRAVVSNACASSHAALYLAKKWLAHSQAVKHVLVLAVDEVGPFIQKGFQSLKALSPSGARPFSGDRDGLALGEGAAALLLSSELPGKTSLLEVSLDSEGYAVTRPSPSGKSLARACLQAFEQSELGLDSVDGILAHGTATQANDLAESATFGALFSHQPWVTCTKWCIGHTLGASGLMDIVAACEILNRQETFAIGATSKLDPSFNLNVLVKGQSPASSQTIQRILVSSLGFGGTHAALLVEKGRA